MHFYLFTLITSCIIPLVMILFGYRFKDGGPKKINSFYGYRSVMSMKNMDTWNFAHRYIGKIWVRNGWIALSLTLAVMLFMKNSSDDVIGTAGLVLLCVQMAFLMFPISLTEKALKENFDASGKRK